MATGVRHRRQLAVEDRDGRDAFLAAESRLLERYGLDVRTRWLDVTNPPRRIRAIEAGAGKPLVLLHGGVAGFAGIWAPLMARMPDRRSIALDLPGHGLSDPMASAIGDPTGLAIRRHRTQAVDLLGSALDALDIGSAVIGGNSIGGLWALWLAIDRPERVASVVLFGCPALVLDAIPRWSLLGPIRRMLRHGPLSLDATRQVLSRVAGPHALKAVADELVEAEHHAQALAGDRAAAVSLLELSVRLGRHRQDLGVGENDLRQVDRPVLLLWADRDRFGGLDVGRRVVDLLPAAKLCALRGGHLPWLDAPASCATAVERLLRRSVVSA